MFLLNSRLGLLIAALRSSGSKSLHSQGHPLSLSYGVNLPSSLTRILSNTLGYLPQPTSVGLRYGRSYPNNGVFLDRVESIESRWVAPQLPPLLGLARGDFPPPAPTIRDAPCPMGTLNLSSCTPRGLANTGGAGILTSCPSPTPLGLGLGPTNPTRINLP